MNLSCFLENASMTIPSWSLSMIPAPWMIASASSWPVTLSEAKFNLSLWLVCNTITSFTILRTSIFTLLLAMPLYVLVSSDHRPPLLDDFCIGFFDPCNSSHGYRTFSVTNPNFLFFIHGYSKTQLSSGMVPVTCVSAMRWWVLNIVLLKRQKFKMKAQEARWAIVSERQAPFYPPKQKQEWSLAGNTEWFCIRYQVITTRHRRSQSCCWDDRRVKDTVRVVYRYLVLVPVEESQGETLPVHWVTGWFWYPDSFHRTEPPPEEQKR